MAIRLGTNPIGWSNDDLRELGGDTPLETCLREAKDAGFEGIELGHKFPRTPDALRAVLSAAGLDLVSGWYSASLLTRDAKSECEVMRSHLDLLKTLDARVLIIAETSNAVHGERGAPLSRRPVLGAGDWSRFCARYDELARATKDHGLSLVYHHHMGTVIQTADEIARLMDGTRDLRLLLDTGHATFAGADPVTLARQWHTRVSHVHCKDVREQMMRSAQNRDLSFLDAVIEGVFTVPGDGMVDFPSVLRAVPGYDGWLVVEAEQDPKKAEPARYARMGCENLRRFAGEAGL